MAQMAVCFRGVLVILTGGLKWAAKMIWAIFRPRYQKPDGWNISVFLER